MLQWKGGGVYFHCGGMAEWFKAAVLKTASRKSGTWVRRPREGEAERAKRTSTSYSFVVDEKKSVRIKFCEKIDCKCGGMAEWFKAAVLKTASRKSGTWVRRPRGGGESEANEHILLLRRRRKEVSKNKVL